MRFRAQITHPLIQFLIQYNENLRVTYFVRSYVILYYQGFI